VADRATLLRFDVPFSTRQPRRALAPKAAGLRTYPAAAFFASAFRPRCAGPQLAMRRPCGFSLFDKIKAASLDPRTVGVGLAVTFKHASQATRLNDRLDLIPVVFWSSARVRSVKPTRLICPHARGGPVGPSAFTPHSSHRPGRVMRRRVLSRGVPLPAVPGLTRPCRTRGPSLCNVCSRVRRTVPSHFTRITRCLVRRRSWGSYPSQVYSRIRVVDAVHAPRLNRVR